LLGAPRWWLRARHRGEPPMDEQQLAEIAAASNDEIADWIVACL